MLSSCASSCSSYRVDHGHRGSRSASVGGPYIPLSPCVSSVAGALMSALPRGLLRDTSGMKARGSEVFVGRTGELGELERALEATRAGTGATVLVAGEAGIGKTRLASELTGRARGGGFEVLVGRSIDLVGTELPYQPFAEALRPLGEPWRAWPEAAAPSCGCSRRRWRCSPSAPPPTRAARTGGSALGRYLHARSGRLPRAQPSRAAGSAARDLPRRRSRVGRAHVEAGGGGPALGSALVLELGPLGRDELTSLLAARTAPPAAGRGGRDRRPLGGQPLLRRRTPRCRGRRRR